MAIASGSGFTTLPFPLQGAGSTAPPHRSPWPARPPWGSMPANRCPDPPTAAAGAAWGDAAVGSRAPCGDPGRWWVPLGHQTGVGASVAWCFGKIFVLKADNNCWWSVWKLSKGDAKVFELGLFANTGICLPNLSSNVDWFRAFPSRYLCCWLGLSQGQDILTNAKERANTSKKTLTSTTRINLNRLNPQKSLSPPPTTKEITC